MGKVTDKNIYYRSADFYEKNGVETMFDTRVTKIDPAAKNVVLADGSTVPYDKLMVATGSKPFVPPMNGMEKIASCHTFMSYDSVKAIKAEEEKEKAAEEVKKEKIAKQIEESSKYYNTNAKPGSLASKAAMVQKYNEAHDKRK